MEDISYDVFLEELESLQELRLRHAEAHPGVPLKGDDPDVRRLIEAMAWFSARTRQAAQRNLFVVQRRLFAQSFPYLLTPLPACVMLQHIPQPSMVEPVDIPTGSELLASSGESAGALFTTTYPVRVLPLHYLRLLARPRASGELRLVLLFETERLAPGYEIGPLSLYINHLSDFAASTEVFHQLRTCLTNVTAYHGVHLNPIDLIDRVGGASCSFRLGPVRIPRGERTFTLNPVEEVRYHLHFPEQSHFLNLQIPKWQPSEDERFATRWEMAICLDLAPQWPSELELTTASFVYGAMVAMNRVLRPSEPILDRGVTTRHPIYFPAGPMSFELLQVHGVYEVTPKGPVALRHGLTRDDPSTYELEQTYTSEHNTRAYLVRHQPRALLNPEILSVEASWHQPQFSSQLGRKLSFAPWRMFLPGITLETVGRPRRHVVNTHRSDMDAFVRTLGLRMRSRLDIGDIRSLLSMLGCLHESHFFLMASLLQDVEVKELLPERHTSRQLRLLYRLKLSPAFQPRQRYMMMDFLAQLRKLLDSWLVGASAEVEAESPSLRETLLPTPWEYL